MVNRRGFLKRAGAAGAVILSGKLFSYSKEGFIGTAEKPNGPFVLPPLPYAYDSLEPYIDRHTMEVHYTKHHQAYVNKLNETPSTNIDFFSDDEVKCTHIDKTTSLVVRNNLGGHLNHSLFWKMMIPNKGGMLSRPSGALSAALEKTWGNFDTFRKEFSDKAMKQFGSGWCWLISSEGNLSIVTTANQDNPLMALDHPRGKILLGLDVWEHAYYLKYQNSRFNYIENWWYVVNWDFVNERYNLK